MRSSNALVAAVAVATFACQALLDFEGVRVVSSAPPDADASAVDPSFECPPDAALCDTFEGAWDAKTIGWTVLHVDDGATGGITTADKATGTASFLASTGEIGPVRAGGLIKTWQLSEDGLQCEFRARVELASAAARFRLLELRLSPTFSIRVEVEQNLTQLVRTEPYASVVREGSLATPAWKRVTFVVKGSGADVSIDGAYSMHLDLEGAAPVSPPDPFVGAKGTEPARPAGRASSNNVLG